jgi:hypothetical protein
MDSVYRRFACLSRLDPGSELCRRVGVGGDVFLYNQPKWLGEHQRKRREQHYQR